MKDETKLVVSGRSPETNFGIVNVPVYHASTVLFSSLKELKERYGQRAEGKQVVTYGRGGTPTAWALEDPISELEGGFRTYLYPSGLAACAHAIQAFVKTGDHILVTDSVYGPTREFCDKTLNRFGVEVTYYDPLIGSGISEFIRPNTTLVYTESPGSLTLEMQDIPAIADAAHKAGLIVLMDNTWASPLYCKPFELGVDVSIQAGTKYIVGHSDVMIGAVTTTKEHWLQLQNNSYVSGQTTGPDDIYLAQRGMKTLSVRLKQHMESALKIAEWLKGRPEVHTVLHPALPDHPGHDIWKRDFRGASGLFSFQLKEASDAGLAAFIENLELFGMGFSWGGYESLAIIADPSHYRTATKWDNSHPLIRLHIGLEDPDDLIADLAAGFDRLNAIK